MPVVSVRYETDREGIRRSLHGDELGDALQDAGRDVIARARPMSNTLAAHWSQERGPDLLIGKYSRRTQYVVNTHRAAAAIEFGSGNGSRGRVRSDGGGRPQGGYSDPKRILAIAGSLVGQYRGELG